MIAIESKAFLTNIKAYERRIKRCSMCNRVNYNKAWDEPENLIKAGMFKSEQDIYVIYTVCDDCRYSPMNNSALMA